MTGTTSFERFGGTTSTRLDLLTLPRAPESIARGAVLGAAMIGARSLAIARPPPVLMTGGRDAVFTGPSGCSAALCPCTPPGGWASRTAFLSCLARRRRGTARKGARPPVLLRWWCTFASAASRPAQCVLLPPAFIVCSRSWGWGLILSSAGFLRRANQVAAAASC